MATSYGAPGVYVEEIPSGSRPIEGVGTSVAAFVGFTQTYHPEQGDDRDPAGVMPQLVTSWQQYERIYGGFARGAMLPYAVSGFFDNGGTKCFIARIPGAQQVRPPHAIIASAQRPEVGSVRVEAVDSDERLEVVITRPEPPADGGEPAQEFGLQVLQGGQPLEEYDALTVGRGARNAERVVNEASTRIRVELLTGPSVSTADRLPQAGTYTLEVDVTEAIQAGPKEVEGSVSERTGLRGLAIAESVNMVCAPDLVTIATSPTGQFDLEGYIAMQGLMVDVCESSKTMMAVLDPPPRSNATGALQWRQQLGRDSSFAAAYYPQLVVADPLAPSGATNGSRFLTVPPCGHMAGVWARTDGSRGVHKAPANEPVRGVVRLESDVTTGEQDLLNPQGVNCIRSFGAEGMRVWGCRTVTISEPEWRYINVRRLFIFLEVSIRRGLRWAVFEPNDQDLRERVKRTITAFLRGVWRSGALVGATPAQAFYVRCDESNNPPESVNEGKLFIEVGVSPVKPAEFVILRITQMESGAAAE